MLRRRRRRVSELVRLFGAHLRSTCGASEGTCRLYCSHAKTFLQYKARLDTIDLSELQPNDLIVFVSEFAAEHAPKTSKLLSTALRALLRFLKLRGVVNERLIEAVPTIPAWKHTGLPIGLSDSQVNALLRAFSPSTPTGRRGLAVVQCMLVLGLRAGEVARLSLDDLDWSAGVLRLPHSKARRVDKLPIQKCVGKAISQYLRYGRPRTSERCVFVRHVKPIGKTVSSSGISQIVRRGFRRAGIQAPSSGSHILRHTAASRMLQKGASLKEIADILRHRNIDTTMIYAKVNLPMLRKLAMPWPEEQP